MPVPVFKPSIQRRDMHSVLSCLVTDVIGPASLSEELTTLVSAEHGHLGGVALREYVRAVEAVAAALGLEAGDSVLISPLTPAAYDRAFAKTGVVPVFQDVREQDACLNPESVEAVEGFENVKAVFLHCPLGRVPDTAAFEELDLPLVVDVGEAVGARDRESRLGGCADFLILPMESEGIVTSGGGTLVLAREKKGLAALNQAVSAFTRDAFLPDLNASLGLVQWRSQDEALESRRMIAEVYTQALMKGRHRTFVDLSEQGGAVPYTFPVVLSSGLTDVRRYARKKGVETLAAFGGRMFEAHPSAEETCPAARSLMTGTLLFPLYPTLGKTNVQLISKVLSTLP